MQLLHSPLTTAFRVEYSVTTTSIGGLAHDAGAALFVTPDVINEYLHRITVNYENRNGQAASLAVRRQFAQAVRNLIRDGLVQLIDLRKNTTIDALERWANSSYGAKDAFHISCQLAWELDLITVDHRLMEALESDPDFKSRTVYFPSLSLRNHR